MSFSITVIGGQLKVLDSNGSALYYPVDDIRLEVDSAANKLLFFHNEIERHSISYSNISSPIGSSVTDVADAIAILMDGTGSISSGNSTTTVLASGATFTGAWEDVSNFQSVVLAVKTDQDGTYSLQFSPDGTNADSTLNRYFRVNQIEVPHRFTVTRKYARVTFTNTSVSTQTYIRFQTMYCNQTILNSPMDSTLSQDFDTILTRPTDFKYEVALGRREGCTTWNKFGYNSDLDIGTELVAAQGGTFTFLTSASTLTIVSSSANDDGSPAGTGARTITIYGVGSTRQALTETITMNGTTPVVTATTWLGINRAVISLAGSTYGNVGNITITATTGGSVQAYIPATLGTTQQCIFFVQDGHKFLADWLILNAERLSSGTQPIVQIRGYTWNPTTNVKTEFLYNLIDVSTETEHQLNPSQPYVFSSGSVFWIEATSDQNNIHVGARFSGIEFKNVDA